jgi:hypothetical protein
MSRDYEQGTESLGKSLGRERAEELLQRATTVCDHERRRIELTNEAAVASRKAEFRTAMRDAERLEQRVYATEPYLNPRLIRRKIVVLWILTFLLVGSGFALSLLTLEPYRLGLKSIFYSAGIALVVPFLVHATLDLFASPLLRKSVTALSCIAALTGVLLFALVRGHLFGQEANSDYAEITIDGQETTSTAQQNTFYRDTVPLLQLAMVLLALGMEVGAGIASHEAERLNAAIETESKMLSDKLDAARNRVSILAEDIIDRQNQGRIFEAEFWRDFHSCVVKHGLAKIAGRAILPCLLAIVLYPTSSRAQVPLHVVVALDLTKSTDQRNSDGTTQFDKNVKAVGQLLERLPAATEVTVFGITSNTFMQPYLILSARLDSDAGYFGEKLSNERRQLLIAWNKQCEGLKPRFRDTDILGAFRLAADFFARQGNANRKAFVIYSDMWQSTPELDLEHRRMRSPSLVDGDSSHTSPDLHDVEVYVLGATASSRTAADWTRLREYWMEYLKSSAANLRSYSVLVSPPTFAYRAQANAGGRSRPK